METVYKAVANFPGGRLESILAGGGSEEVRTLPMLVYKEGEITYAPEGSNGVYVSETEEKARDVGMWNKTRIKGIYGAVVTVHEAIPLGNRKSLEDAVAVRGLSAFAEIPRYPAILLGKEVWRETPKEQPGPVPKFKVGDSVTVPISTTGIPDGYTDEVSFVTWGEGLAPSHKHWHYNIGTWLADEDELVLAPMKEWEDITKKCIPKLFMGQLYLSYPPYWIVFTDAKGEVILSPGTREGEEFRVEVVKESSKLMPTVQAHTFKVFKRK